LTDKLARHIKACLTFILFLKEKRMSLSLHDAVIPSFAQILGTTAKLIDKAQAYATESGLSAEDVIGLRLAPDMLPLGYQVASVAGHSAGALKGVQSGVFSPDMTPWPTSFEGLRGRIADAQAVVTGMSADVLNGLQGKPMRFEMGERKIPFTAEGFLFSFSIPNMHFHATTAYDILRHNGVKLGKMDYLGQLQLAV
jgi:uncharacterized protein